MGSTALVSCLIGISILCFWYAVLHWVLKALISSKKERNDECSNNIGIQTSTEIYDARYDIYVHQDIGVVHEYPHGYHHTRSNSFDCHSYWRNDRGFRSVA